MEKPAPAAHPVHELVARRFSPCAFAARPVDPDALRSLFEAARWAPSASNGQPWRFVVATAAEPETLAAFVGALAEGNQRWARAAPVLVFAVTEPTRGEGKPNLHARYDLGQAVAWLSVEATARGLRVHQMGGFDAERARAAAGIPADLDVVTAIALGHPGDPGGLPDDLRARETAPRQRRPQAEFVFGPRWGTPR